MTRFSPLNFWNQMGFSKWQLYLSTFSLMVCFIWGLSFVYQYSIDFLVEDRADWWGDILNGKGWVEGFFKQHGPHRLGLLFLLAKFSNSIAPLNISADLYVNVFMLLFTAILGLRLKWKYTRMWNFSDVIIPFVILSTYQWEIYIVSPHIHVMLPFFSLLMGNFLLSDKRDDLFYSSLLFFIAAFSVYALFAAIVFWIIQSVFWLRKKNYIHVLIFGFVGLAAAAAYLYGFKFDYLENTPSIDWQVVVKAPYLLTLNFLGLRYMPLGIWLSYVLILGIFFLVGVQLIKSKDKEVPILLLFSFLIFSILQIIGRSYFGEGVFNSARYFTGMTMLVWIIVINLKHFSARHLVQFLWGFMLFGILIRPKDPRWGAQKVYISKVVAWKECYQSTRNVEACNVQLEFEINPDPEKFNLKETWEKLGQIKKTK